MFPMTRRLHADLVTQGRRAVLDQRVQDALLVILEVLELVDQNTEGPIAEHVPPLQLPHQKL